MRVIFLDDMSERHELFAKFASAFGWDVMHVTTGEDALAAIVMEKFDAAFLDHDLNDDQNWAAIANLQKTTEALDGREVVSSIVAMPERMRPTCFVVHSMNPVGSLSMCQTLVAANLKVLKCPFMVFSSREKWPEIVKFVESACTQV